MAPPPILACGDLVLDARLARLTGPDGVERCIYPSMANLLHVLMRQPGDVVPQDRCIMAVGPSAPASSNVP